MPDTVVRITFERPLPTGGVWRDAITVPTTEWSEMTQDEIEAMQESRFAAYLARAAAPEDPPEE